MDFDTCWNIDNLNENLMTAETAEQARAAADALEKYNPPHLVRNAIEHFVTTLGAQPDPDNSSMSYLINDWFKQICPVLLDPPTT